MQLYAHSLPQFVCASLLTLVCASACEGSKVDNADDGTGGSDGTTSSDEDGETGSGAVDDPQRPPASEAALTQWLQAGHYLSWASESAAHESTGPHFGGVRTWLNTAAVAGLEASAEEFAVGAAAVKELYGAGSERRGWAVSVRTQAGAGGDAWYWYELYDDRSFADGNGVQICVNCHSAGQDYLLTPFPLE